MRHRKSGKHLNRTSSHRKAMFSNMSTSLIEHEMIKTTVVKAKELRRHVEPLITLAKNDSVANRRLAFAKLRDSAAVGKLFTELGPRYADRPGGYTRILKAGYRKGDSAMVAYIELVDRESQDAGIESAEDETSAAPVAALEDAAATTEETSTTVVASTVDEIVAPPEEERQDDVVEETTSADDSAATDTELSDEDPATVPDEEESPPKDESKS